MTEDELFDLLSDLEEAPVHGPKAVRFERAAAGVATGEYGRAALLIAAGEHWEMSQAYDDARRCFEAAQADGGESATDPIANLLSLALAIGDDAEADQHLSVLRDAARADRLTVANCHHIGETLELHDRLREAHRWFTMPLSWAQDDEDLDDLCLYGRLRVRRELGLAPDRLDQLAQRELDEQAQG